MSQEIITSADGTRIACWRSGEGPPLVLVHGTAAEHGRWRAVLPAFEQHRLTKRSLEPCLGELRRIHQPVEKPLRALFSPRFRG